MKTLWTTRLILERVSDQHKLLNNNQISLKFGVNPSVVLNWSRGAVMEKEEHIRRAAELLGDDEGWVSLCLAIERVKSTELAEKMRDLLLAATNRVALVAPGFLVGFAPLIGHFGMT